MRLMRQLAFVTLLGAVTFTAIPAFAAEEKCPLEIGKCLHAYQRMRERPWLGVGVERDSSKQIIIRTVEPGSPADRAGVKPGDVLQRIEGRVPSEWFAGKAGWKTGEAGSMEVLRQGRTAALTIKYEGIPEELFARIIGVHIIGGHLAYMGDGKADASEDR